MTTHNLLSFRDSPFTKSYARHFEGAYVLTIRTSPDTAESVNAHKHVESCQLQWNPLRSICK
jgi:hypothetical protein